MIIDFSEGDGGKMVSVIIPVLNESATITSVVKFARRDPLVREVIVVDDGSIDGTPELATEAGARVITSTLLGKGASMQDGLREARSEIVLYLDGDLRSLNDQTISLMVKPLLEDTADLVKAKFARKAGRVTTLTAKPLLRTYFPELSHLDQPLSGVVAARKSLLTQLRFENDYGVDVGLLIDALTARARICEMDIGYLEHRNHSLEALGEMATQVTRTILERAAVAGRLSRTFIREVKESERINRLSLDGFMERVPTTEKLALFDMDGVLLDARFIVSLAQVTHRESDLAALLDNFNIPPGLRMKQIAELFKGVSRELIEEVAMQLPLMPGAVETVVGLRKAGFRVGIITDSYHIVSEIIRRRVFADFSFAHFMRFKNGKATGRVTLCPAMIHPEGCSVHDHCKVNVLLHLKERLNICPSQVLAVGDGENDICLLQAAACSVAFRGKTPNVRAAARYRTKQLADVLSFVNQPERRTRTVLEEISPLVSN